MSYSPRWRNSELLRERAKEKGMVTVSGEGSMAVLGRKEGWREASWGTMKWSGTQVCLLAGQVPRPVWAGSQASQSWSSQQKTGCLTGFPSPSFMQSSSSQALQKPTFRADLKNSQLEGSYGLKKPFVIPGAWDLACRQLLVNVWDFLWIG